MRSFKNHPIYRSANLKKLRKYPLAYCNLSKAKSNLMFSSDLAFCVSKIVLIPKN